MSETLEKYIGGKIDEHDKRLNSLELTTTQLAQISGQNANDNKELKLAQSNMATRIDTNLDGIKKDFSSQMKEVTIALNSIQLAMAKTAWIPSLITGIVTAIAVSLALTFIGRI